MNLRFRILLPLLLFLLPGTGSAETTFSEAELDQMLAPIALYPDSLLAQVLTAATYPLEIIEATRWSAANSNLSGDEAVESATTRGWDPSVTSLVAFPDLLKKMSDELDWTQRLGEAVLLQEDQVMASIQRLRDKAHTAGNLDSVPEVAIRRESEIIYIEPANPEIIRIPYYQPAIVYGTWWWPSHPPVYWSSPSYLSTGSSYNRIIWSRPYPLSTHYFYSYPNWPRNQIIIHRHYNKRPSKQVQRPHRDWEKYNTPDRWQHRPEHRRGARYKNDSLSNRFPNRNHPRRNDPFHPPTSSPSSPDNSVNVPQQKPRTAPPLLHSREQTENHTKNPGASRLQEQLIRNRAQRREQSRNPWNQPPPTQSMGNRRIDSNTDPAVRRPAHDPAENSGQTGRFTKPVHPRPQNEYRQNNRGHSERVSPPQSSRTSSPEINRNRPERPAGSAQIPDRNHRRNRSWRDSPQTGQPSPESQNPTGFRQKRDSRNDRSWQSRRESQDRPQHSSPQRRQRQER